MKTGGKSLSVRPQHPMSLRWVPPGAGSAIGTPVPGLNRL
jgi:hypothetical protein